RGEGAQVYEAAGRTVRGPDRGHERLGRPGVDPLVFGFRGGARRRGEVEDDVDALDGLAQRARVVEPRPAELRAEPLEPARVAGRADQRADPGATRGQDIDEMTAYEPGRAGHQHMSYFGHRRASKLCPPTEKGNARPRPMRPHRRARRFGGS